MRPNSQFSFVASLRGAGQGCKKLIPQRVPHCAAGQVCITNSADADIPTNSFSDEVPPIFGVRRRPYAMSFAAEGRLIGLRALFTARPTSFICRRASNGACTFWSVFAALQRVTHHVEKSPDHRLRFLAAKTCMFAKQLGQLRQSEHRRSSGRFDSRGWVSVHRAALRRK